MRKPLVAGNWKMNKTVADTRRLISELIPGLQSVNGVDKVLCPPFTALLAASALLDGTDIWLGAQNMHWEAGGAYTGEISPGMVSELCKYIIIGHSERRLYFGETDETVNRKVKAAYSHGLTPIVCVGETLSEYENGQTNEVVRRQTYQGLLDLDSQTGPLSPAALVVAYEPVWAIGTGKPSTPEGASQVIAEVIRPVLADLFSPTFSQGVRVLYGGSVTEKNAAEFFLNPEIDGGLVGGASLKPGEFLQITMAAVT